MGEQLEKLEHMILEQEKEIRSVKGDLLLINKHLSAMEKAMLDNRLVENKKELDS